MSIYNVNGMQTDGAYNINGDSVLKAYDINGFEVFPNEPITLKIANYNVGGWYYGGGTNVPVDKYNTYHEMQNDVFSNVNADILCLEEYWTYFSGTTKATDAVINSHYPYSHGVNGTSQYFGRCVCSKYPIVDYTENNFLDDANRYYDVVTINVGGILIKVFITHLSTSSNPQVRVDEAVIIHNYIESHEYEKYLVFGDFNVSATDPLSEYNLQVFGDFLEDGCALVNGGSFGVFDTYSRNSTYDDNLTVDNIIVSDAFTIQSAGVDLTKVQFQATNGDKIDHIPLYATIQIN